MGEPESIKRQKEIKRPNKIVSFLSNLIREILAIFIWGYVIAKLFVFDIDNYLVERLIPNYTWLLTYKFFIIIVLISIIWLAVKNTQIILWSLFVFFYPLIIILWRIPILIFKKKSWNFAFAFTDSIIYFFKSIKKAFATTSFFLASTVVVLVSQNTILLWLSIAVLLIILLLVYIQRVVLVFKPSGIYQIYSRFFYNLGEYLRKSPLVGKLNDDESVLPIESMEEKQIQKWVSHVQQLVLLDKTCLFVAKKMKSYQNSGFTIVSSIFGVLLLALYTVFSFAVINYGLYKIDQHFYSLTATPSFFNFFYYSFNLLLFNSIQEITAIAPLSQVAFMSQSFFVLFLIAILVSLVLTFRSQKDAEELKDAIEDLSGEGTRIEVYIKDKYKVDNIEVAITILQKLEASFNDYLAAIAREL